MERELILDSAVLWGIATGLFFILLARWGFDADWGWMDRLAQWFKEWRCLRRTGALPQTGPLAPRHKPWQLIRDAICDLQLQRTSRYAEIVMCEWHNPERNSRPGAVTNRCAVCLAGSTMARRLNVDNSSCLTADDFSSGVRCRLNALDYFRQGEVFDGLQRLGLHDEIETLRDAAIPDFIKVAKYHDDPEGFISDMLSVADMLERFLSEEPSEKTSEVQHV